MNKEQIKEIMEHKPQDLEVEIFVHGAICFGYSGRCFLSDFLASRSATLVIVHKVADGHTMYM